MFRLNTCVYIVRICVFETCIVQLHKTYFFGVQYHTLFYLLCFVFHPSIYWSFLCLLIENRNSCLLYVVPNEKKTFADVQFPFSLLIFVNA